MITISATQLRQAGFDEKTVVGYINEQRPLLQKAGFSNVQINNHFGITPTENNIIPASELETNALQESDGTIVEPQVIDQNQTLAAKRIEAGTLQPSSNLAVDPPLAAAVEQQKESLLTEGSEPSEDSLIKPPAQADTMGDNVIEDTDAPPPDTPDYNTALYEQIAERQAETDAYRKKLLDKGLIAYSDLTQEEKDTYDSVVNIPMRGGFVGAEEVFGDMLSVTRTIDGEEVKLRVDTRPAPAEKYEKVTILNTTVTTGPTSQALLSHTAKKYALEADDIATLNEGMSFISALESDNRNIYNEFDTKAGVFQIPIAEMESLLNQLGNALAEEDPSWVQPRWMKNAYIHKDPTKLSLDVQRSLALIKLMNSGVSDEYLQKAARGDTQAFRALYEIGYNPTSGDGSEHSAEWFERNEEYLGKMNTLDYEFGLPEVATWNNDWWITEKSKESYIGRKFIKLTGADGTVNVFETGYRKSVTGMMQAYHSAVTVDGKSPQQAYEEIFMHQTGRFDQALIETAMTIVGDLPQMGVGFVGGVGTGIGLSATTGGLAAPATPFIAMGTSFALPEAMRDVYTRALLNGDVNNFDELMEETFKLATAKTFGKGMVVGAGSFAAGKTVAAFGAGQKTRMLTEAGSMVSLMSALEGQVPSKQDFAHAAVLVFGIHGASKGVNKLYHIYQKYGMHPRDMLTLMEKRTDVRSDLLDPDMPEPNYFAEINKIYSEALEKSINVKTVEPPKHNPDATITTSESHTDVGKVVDRQETSTGEVILKVEDPVGETVFVRESETGVSQPIDSVSAVIEPDGKVRVKPKTDTQFEARKENGEFAPDVIEYKLVVRDNTIRTAEVNAQVQSSLKSDLTINTKDLSTQTTGGKDFINTPDVFIDTAAYPQIAKTIQSIVPKPKKGKDGRVETVNKKLQSADGLAKLDVVFAIERDGPSKMPVNSVVVRNPYGEMFAVPQTLLNEIATISRLPKGEKTPTREAAELSISSDGQVVAIDPRTGSIIAAIKAIKVNNKTKQQAESYYQNHKPDGEKTFQSRERHNDGADDWGMPDEPPQNMQGGQNSDVPVVRNVTDALFNNARGLDTFDLVGIVRALIDQNPILEHMPAGTRGYFQAMKVKLDGKDVSQMKIAINKALQDDPQGFTATLAHEIGHLIDYLPNEVIERNNVLGNLAALKGHLNDFIAGKEDGAKPLNDVEIAALKAEAEAVAAKNEPKTDADITETLNITPEKIADILRDPDIRSKIDPEFYDAFAKLDGPLKKQVLISAMKGMIDPHIKTLVDRINGKKPTTDAEKVLSAEADAIFKKMFEAQIRERGLVSRLEVTKELKALSALWKPFKRQEGSEYTTYRDSPPELMADFMMAFLLRPRWTMQNAPRSAELFLNYMHKRPDVKKLYDEMQHKLHEGPDARAANIITELSDGFAQNRRDIVERMDNQWQPSKIDDAHTTYLDTFAYFYRRFGGPNGWRAGTKRWMDNAALELNGRIENFRYRHAYMQRYMQSMDSQVLNPIEELGYSSSELSTMLLLRNLAFSTQRSGVVSTKGLWAQIKEMSPEGEAIANKVSQDLTPRQLYDYMAKQMPAVDAAATKFFELRQEYMHPVLKESKAFDAETLQMMLDNKEYITFDVADYMFKRLDKSGGRAIANKVMKRTTGSLADLTDPFLATLEKDLMLLTELKRNRLMFDTIKWLTMNKKWLETFDQKTGKKDPVIQKAKFIGEGQVEPAPRGFKLVHVMTNGKPKYYYMNKFAADAFDANPFQYFNGLQYLQSSTDFFRAIFTEYNPYFWTKNMFKDTNRAVRNLPKARYFDLKKGGKNAYMKYLFKSLKPTFKSIYGDGTDLTLAMEKEGFLISQIDGYRGRAGEQRVEKMVQDGDIPADAAIIERMMQKFKPKEYQTVYENTFGRMFDHMGNIARILERMHKVAGKMYLDDMIARNEISMSSAEMMLKIQADVGSPSFLRTGKMHPVTNNVWMFSNAMKEGIRGDYVRAKEDPRSVGGKFITYNLAPKALNWLMKFGVLGVGYATFFNGVSDYDEKNYIIIPLGYTDSGKPIYFRIPQDETARVMNGFMGMALDSAFGKGDTGITNFMQALNGDVSPSLNPVFGFLSDSLSFAQGHNPINSFTGQYALNDDVWKAQNIDTKKEALKYMWNTYGGSSIYRFKSDDINEITSELEDFLAMPIAGQMVGTFIKVGDHPVKQDIYRDYEILERDRARDTLLFKSAMKKMLGPDAENEKLTKQEIIVVGKRANYLRNNRTLLDNIAKRTGGTELLQMLLSARTSEKQIIAIQRINDFMQNGPEDFPVLFETE